MYFHNKQPCTIIPYLELTILTIKGRLRVHDLLAHDHHVIVILIPKIRLTLLPLNDVLQRALAKFSGELSSHYPAVKKWHFPGREGRASE